MAVRILMRLLCVHLHKQTSCSWFHFKLTQHLRSENTIWRHDMHWSAAAWVVLHVIYRRPAFSKIHTKHCAACKYCSIATTEKANIHLKLQKLCYWREATILQHSAALGQISELFQIQSCSYISHISFFNTQLPCVSNCDATSTWVSVAEQASISYCVAGYRFFMKTNFISLNPIKFNRT